MSERKMFIHQDVRPFWDEVALKVAVEIVRAAAIEGQVVPADSVAHRAAAVADALVVERAKRT